MTEAHASYIPDSLPYYDNDLEQFPVLREKVDRELAKEGKPPQEFHPRVPPAFELFANHPLLQAEMQRVEAHEPLPPLDTIRYQLPAPTSAEPNDEEWQNALKNAYAQQEHQLVRQSNLSLLQKYGSNAWKIHNYRLDSTAKQAEQSLEELKQLTTDVNRERKNFQERLGTELTGLETRWTELISEVLQIEMANAALEGEIDRLRQKEADLVGL